MSFKRSIVGGGAEKPDASAERAQMVTFSVGSAEFALDVMRLREIIRPLPISPVPDSPPFIEGVILLRGAVLPVINLRRRFGLEPPGPGGSSKILIVLLVLGGLTMQLGLVVDAVGESIRLGRDQIQLPPPLALGTRAFFSGVVRWRDRIVMVLDLDAVLSTDERLALPDFGRLP